jgi:hypothetical protein
LGSQFQKFQCIFLGSVDSGPIVREKHVAEVLTSWQAEREQGLGMTFKVILPLGDLLPQDRPHLLKFPPPPKIAPPGGDQALNP